MEFELKTDAGAFPVPVAVDSTGMLRMELGGSKTYTLSCVASPVSVPEPEPVEEIQPLPSDAPTESIEAEPVQELPEQPGSGMPAGHLILFIAGTAAAAGGLFIMWHAKRRRESYGGYEEDDDE